MSRNEIFIPGLPTPEGSHKSFINPKTGKVVTLHAADGLEAWRDTIALYVRNFPKYGKHVPVAVAMWFHFVRPKTVTREHMVVPPDGDKLDRAVFDALTKARVVHDDAQIVKHYAEKTYGPKAGAKILVTDDTVGFPIFYC